MVSVMRSIILEASVYIYIYCDININKVRTNYITNKTINILLITLKNIGGCSKASNTHYYSLFNIKHLIEYKLHKHDTRLLNRVVDRKWQFWTISHNIPGSSYACNCATNITIGRSIEGCFFS